MTNSIESIQLSNSAQDHQFDYTLHILRDEGMTPEEMGDCYSNENIAYWKSDEWFFALLKLTVSRHDIALSDAYLGGVEYGQLDQHTEITIEKIASENDYVLDLIAEATAEARATIAKLALA
jgi:hypothetical protein